MASWLQRLQHWIAPAAADARLDAVAQSPFEALMEHMKASRVGQLIAIGGEGQPAWTPDRYDRLAIEGYQLNVVANRCISLRADSFAALELMLQAPGGSANREHAMLELLERPNVKTGGARFRRALVAYADIAGNCYVERVVVSGTARELWPLRPSRVQVLEGRTGIPAAYRYETARGRVDFPVDPISGDSDVLHLADFHPDNDWYGFSRTKAAGRAIDQHNAAGQYNASLLYNGVKPSGWLVYKGPGGNALDAQVKRAESIIDNKWSGPANAGKVHVLGGEWEFLSDKMTMRDMEFQEGTLAKAREICAAYGVPHVLVVPGEQTWSNRDQAYLELYEATILPMADIILGDIHRWLAPLFGKGADRLKLTYDRDKLWALTPRRVAHSDSIVKIWSAGITTRDEARASLQLPPAKEGGGDYAKPSADQQMELQNNQAQAQAQARADAGGPPGAAKPKPKPSIGKAILAMPARKSLYGIPGTFAAVRVAEASARALEAWAKAHGIANVVPAGQMHVTTVYSLMPVPAYEPHDWLKATIRPEHMGLALFGHPDGHKALVLTMTDGDTWWLESRHREALSLGAVPMWPEYRPHLTISYDPGQPPPGLKAPPFGLLLEGEFVEQLEGDEEAVPPDQGGARPWERQHDDPWVMRRAETVLAGKAVDPDEVADELPDEAMIGEVSAVMRDVIAEAGQRVFDELNIGIRFDLLDPNVTGYLEEWGATRIKQLVGTTTREALAKSLRDGVIGGETTEELMARIRSVFTAATKERARMIAETEITNAAGFAGQLAMQQAGTDFKQWLATEDNHVRDAHRALNGQIQPVAEPFVVPPGSDGAGARAMHPGGFGKAELDIYCRCGSIPFVPGIDGPLPEHLQARFGLDADGEPVDGEKAEKPSSRRRRSLEEKARELARWRKRLELRLEEAIKRGFRKQQEGVLRRFALLEGLRKLGVYEPQQKARRGGWQIQPRVPSGEHGGEWTSGGGGRGRGATASDPYAGTDPAFWAGLSAQLDAWSAGQGKPAAPAAVAKAVSKLPLAKQKVLAGRTKTAAASAVTATKAALAGKAQPPTPAVTASAPRPAGEAKGWKPKMTAAEAAEWSKNSAIKVKLYHATSGDAAAAIAKSGFSDDRALASANIRFGSGHYAAYSKADVSEYLQSAGKGGKALTLAVNVQKVLHVKTNGGEDSPEVRAAMRVGSAANWMVAKGAKPENAYNKYFHLNADFGKIPKDEVIKALSAVQAAKGAGMPARGQGFQNFLLNRGYGAISYKGEDERHIPQIVVFRSRDVTVVEG